MANIKSAKKRAIQNESRRKSNMALKSIYRTHIKKVTAAITTKDKDKAITFFKETSSMLDRVVAKGVLHSNTVARYKSRLSSSIKKLNSTAGEEPVIS